MDTILQRLTDLDEISGAILIGKDGLIVSGALHSEDEEMLGANVSRRLWLDREFYKSDQQWRNASRHH